MPQTLWKGHLKTMFVPNFKPRGHHWWHCGWIFKFCKFWRKKMEIKPFDVISENSSPKGFFWRNKKTSVILLLSADSRYFQTYTLKLSENIYFSRVCVNDPTVNRRRRMMVIWGTLIPWKDNTMLKIRGEYYGGSYSVLKHQQTLVACLLVCLTENCEYYFNS